MSQEQKKRNAAKAAIEHINNNAVIGVGTGSTVNFFIEELAKNKGLIDGAVSSSVATENLLKQHNIPVVPLNSVIELPIYIDGADEVTRNFYMTKGGGGALTKEKILAADSKKLICIVDNSKIVDVLGKYPLPIEVIPMAKSYISRMIVRLGGQPELRQNFLTDNGNLILDVHNLTIIDPPQLEKQINNIAGVVTNGIFAIRPADVVLIGQSDGILTLENK